MTVVKLTVLFWVVTPYVLVCKDQHFTTAFSTIYTFGPEVGNGAFLQMLVSTYKSIKCHNPEQHHCHLKTWTMLHLLNLELSKFESWNRFWRSSLYWYWRGNSNKILRNILKMVHVVEKYLNVMNSEEYIEDYAVRACNWNIINARNVLEIVHFCWKM